MKNKQNGFGTAGTIIAIVAVSIVGGAFYILNTGTEEAETMIMEDLIPIERESPGASDWKSYRNEEYGFEIKHPESFNFTEEVKWDNPAGSSFNFENDGYVFSFDVNPAGKGLGLTKQYATRDVTLAGNDVELQLLEDYDPELSVFIVILDERLENRFFVKLRCKSLTCDKDGTQVLFDQIISELKIF